MPRAGLDTDAVVRAAAALVDAEGSDRLTLARLARRLNVRIPSLYNHIAGLEGLRRALTLHTLRHFTEALGRAASGRHGDEALGALADAYRAFVKAHPGLYSLVTRASTADDAELGAAQRAPVAVVLAVLADYGLDGEEAIHAVRAVRSAIHGFVSLEIAGGFGLPIDLDESFRRLVRLCLDGLHQRHVAPDA